MDDSSCAICMDDESPLIGGICPKCCKEYKGEDSVQIIETADEVTALPEFSSWDDMIKFSDALKSGKTSVKTVKKGSTKVIGKQSKRSPKAPKTAPVASPEVIWQARHLYKRDGVEFGHVLKDARMEAQYAGDNVLVFAHDHFFNESCTNKCQEKIAQ